MLTPEIILRWCGEKAEMEYLGAKARGVRDPVISLTTQGESPESRTVEFHIDERAHLLEILRQDPKLNGLVELLSIPPAAGHFTVAVTRAHDVYILERPIPGVPGMYTWEEIEERFGAKAEEAYFQGKAQGIADPVVQLVATEQDYPKVRVFVDERIRVIESLRKPFGAAADRLLARPSDFGRFDITIILPDAVEIVDREIPTG